MGSMTGPNLLRIASASGSVTDRRHGFLDIAKNEDVQYIVGDWMSEYNMTTRGAGKISDNGVAAQFEETFLEAILPALPFLEQRKIKVVVNAGASDTERLYQTLVSEIEKAGVQLRVAWVSGDEVMDAVQAARKSGDDFTSLTTGKFNSRDLA